ncbi:MAG: TPM domain-containing protein [Nitrospirae bacterium]|nr:TPM domain-containing protein [Nitrospirota bacterium]
MTVGLLAALLLILAATQAFAAHTFPEPRGHVSDYAGVLKPDEAAALEGYLAELEKRTSAEVAVVTVPDLDGFADVDEYAVDLFAAWKIGKKGQDNGVLILLAVKEKKLRIEVGYGLEGAITDGTAGGIIRDTMVPYFKRGEFGAGLMAGAQAVAERVPEGGVQTPIDEQGGKEQPSSLSLLIIVVLLAIFLFPLFFGPGGPMGGGKLRRGRGGFYGGGPFIGGFGGGFGGGGGGGGGFGGFGGGFSGGGGASGDW